MTICWGQAQGAKCFTTTDVSFGTRRATSRVRFRMYFGAILRVAASPPICALVVLPGSFSSAIYKRPKAFGNECLGHDISLSGNTAGILNSELRPCTSAIDLLC